MQDYNLFIALAICVLLWVLAGVLIRKFGDLSIKFNPYKTTLIADGIEVSVSCVFNLKSIPIFYLPVYMIGRGSFRDLLGDKIELAVHHVNLHNNNSFMFKKREVFAEKIAHILKTDNWIGKWFDVEDVQVVDVFLLKDTSGPTEEEKREAEERAERYHEDLKKTLQLKMQVEAEIAEQEKKRRIALAQAESEAAKQKALAKSMAEQELNKPRVNNETDF